MYTLSAQVFILSLAEVKYYYLKGPGVHDVI